MIFESGLDDQAVELVKLALCDVLWNKYHRKAAACFFCYVDEPADRVGFSVFWGTPSPSANARNLRSTGVRVRCSRP